MCVKMNATNDQRPVTWEGSTGYYLTPQDLARVKRCAKIARLDWRAIAARPSTALEFCAQVERDSEPDRLKTALHDLLPFAINPELLSHGGTPDRWHPEQFNITRAQAILAARALLTP